MAEWQGDSNPGPPTPFHWLTSGGTLYEITLSAPSRPSLTNTGCAILIGLKAAVAALVTAATVSTIGVDADGPVPWTHKGKFYALVHV